MPDSSLLDTLDLNQIQDLDSARKCIVMLLNLVEEMQQQLRQAQEQIQRLQDEVNRLKGEQGKPKIKPNQKAPDPGESGDYSSEKERHQPKEHHKRRKLESVKIHETRTVEVDPSVLPADAEFKGYEEVVVQDLEVHAHNTLFRKQKYYSPSEKRAYQADLPAGYEGEFGPGVKSLALVLYFGCNMTEPKLLEFFRNAGVQISAGQVSSLLIKKQDRFHEEKDAIFEAGLESSPWQGTDHTSTRVNGSNQYCQVVCNPLYTAYFTTGKKNRLGVLDVLRNFRERTFLLNEESFAYLAGGRLSAPLLEQLRQCPAGVVLTEPEFEELLAEHLPALGPRQRSSVQEAGAIAAYHAEMEFPVIHTLVCDDAGEFKRLTEELSLCWVHDGRLYKKLSPFVAYHRTLLDDFLGRYWGFYGELREYRENPSPAQAMALEKQFDELFSTVTGYEALDARIAKTNEKKATLLLVLKHPELPLHNNDCELAARVRVRKRDVSFGPRTAEGVRAWDTFMTVLETAKKLGVNVYDYIYDRVSQAFQMPTLASLIAERARELRLGASWSAGP